MGRKAKPKILCVEDHGDTCELITIILPEFEIITVSTKGEAIDKAREGGFSLILMDYYLPDGTGEQACRMIRAFDQHTPILFVTGSVDLTYTKALSIGAHGLVKKATSDFLEELRERAMQLAVSLKDR